MVDLNHIEMSGHLAGDTEIKQTKSGKKITLFSIATNDDYKKEEQWQDRCYFFNVMYLGEKKLEKGTPIVIEGKLVQITPKELIRRRSQHRKQKLSRISFRQKMLVVRFKKRNINGTDNYR